MLFVVKLIFMLSLMDLLLNLVQIDMRNGVLAVEDSRDLFQSGSVGLNVEDPNKDEFDQIPELRMQVLVRRFS